MAALVSIDLVCDVCSLIGPIQLEVGDSRELLLPEGWDIREGWCVCSITCYERRGEVAERNLTPVRKLFPGREWQQLYCIAQEVAKCISKLVEASKLSPITLRRQYTPILPPGWIDPSKEEDSTYRGYRPNVRVAVCPVCVQARYQDKETSAFNSAQGQLQRNGRWGTCVHCPREGNRVYPERCINTHQWDHNRKEGQFLIKPLDIEDLYERDRQ